MKTIAIVRGYEGSKYFVKLTRNYPDVAWVVLVIPVYDKPEAKMEALNNIVDQFDNFLFLDQWHYKDESVSLYAMALAKQKNIYTKKSFPIKEECEAVNSEESEAKE